ncbi:MAG: anti-sigma factor family protein [Candidatus Dormibacterales bacterium]
MKCRQVVELMTEYLEGTLSTDDRVRFEEHIAGCDGCRAYLEQMRRTRQVLGRLAEEPVPTLVKAELVRAFRNWKTA